jgi:site-specific recombinase
MRRASAQRARSERFCGDVVGSRRFTRDVGKPQRIHATASLPPALWQFCNVPAAKTLPRSAAAVVARRVQDRPAMQRKSSPSISTNQPMYRRLDELCEFAPGKATPEERVFWFVQLVRWLSSDAEHKKGLRLRYLRTQLEQQPAWRENVSQTINALLGSWDFEQLLAYGGIPRDFHFAGAVKEWLRFRVLPTACSTTDAVEVLMLAFEREDTRWFSEPELGKLAAMLVDLDTRLNITRALERALISLSNQLVAQAHSPSVINLSRVERSPFAGLNGAVESFVAQARSERQTER